MDEKRLWQAVIERAVLDARGEHIVGSRTYQHNERKRAIRWVLIDNEEFDEVCQGAGFEPAYIRRGCRSIITSAARVNVGVARALASVMESTNVEFSRIFHVWAAGITVCDSRLVSVSVFDGNGAV